MKAIWLKAACVAALMLLAGCEEETTLYAQLEERQANAIIAELKAHDISCRKTPGEEGTWNGMVSEPKFAEAVNLLERKGLPRRSHMGVGEVFKKPCFHEDGTFERSVADRKAKGVWMVNGEKLLLAIQNVQTASLTTHLEDGKLTLVIQAARVLQMMQTLGALSDSKATKALVKVSKKLSGIEGGFLFEKK